MAVAMMMLSLQAMAQTFSYTHQGKTLYYDIISDSTVEVTYYNNIDYVSGDVVIPSTVTYNGTTYSVTSIGDYAFWDCSGLTSVTIPNSVTSIGDGAFYDCSSLTSINVASGNTHYSSIDGVLYNYVQDTLIQCPGAKTSVTIGNNVTSIGGGAFEDCSGLTSVTIPNSVTSIGNKAFYGCSGLTTLNFNAINCQNFGNDYTFGTSLTTVNIGDSVQRIPANFVSGCRGLTSVTIPTGVTSIRYDAFRDCSGLTSITIPTGVTFIGWGAFSGCSSLTSVRCLAVTPPSIDSNSFSDVPSTCTLTVPCGSLGAYAGSDWNKYFSERISEE